MSCSRTHAQLLVKRLRRLPFAGDAGDASGAREEVGETLIRTATDDEHANRITDRLIEEMHSFPVPADVIDAASATRRRAEDYYDPRKPPRCYTCQDTGFVIVKRGDYEAAKPCDCRKVAV